VKGITMQTTRRIFLGAAAGAVLLQSGSTALAASPEPTTVYVSDLHCQNCARKVAGKLFAVKGVVKVQAGLEKKLFLITPQVGKSVSARDIWDAVVAGDAEPTKLVGPSGTFDSKPNG
jgi:copper chaperone CopZ